MMCEACERGDHDNCGMQTWCECDCAGYHDVGLPERDPDDNPPPLPRDPRDYLRGIVEEVPDADRC